MLDINLIREKPDWVREQIKKLNDPTALERVGKIIELDKQRRTLLTEGEAIQAARNKLNKSVGRLRGDKKMDAATRGTTALRVTEALDKGDYDRAVKLIEGGEAVTPDAAVNTDAAMEDLMTALKSMGDRVNTINEEVRQVDAQLDENMLWLPNLPHESVPVADSEEANIAWTPEGNIREFDFDPKAHWDLGPELGIIDFERGVKLAGTRAYVLKGWGSRLQRALISLYLDLARAKGFTEFHVPFFVKEDMLYGSGQFPKFRDVVYFDPDAEIYMLPTAEVALANLHRDEILDEDQLPLYYVAHTPCFRREKLSAGRDVRGIKRVHQFEKVEMFKFTTPETSYAELESLTQAAEDICRKLELPFRRLEIVTGDLGFSASKKYDVEVWSPGCKEWLEVSSCSNTEAFQARRANIKYRPKDSKKAQFVHTLNGSGLADTRVMIAVLENYQQADGSVVIPDVLRPYLGGADRITKA